MSPFFLITILPGLTFIVLGIVLTKFPPAKINRMYGYRTPSSMKNIDTWATANKYCANIFAIEGVLLTALSLFSLLRPDTGFNGIFIGVGLLGCLLVTLVLLTERHLAKLFDKNGNRKV